MRPLRFFLAASLWGAFLFLSGCAPGLSASSKRSLDGLIARQDYAGAESFIDGQKELGYGRKNMILYYLDKGLVQHHQGKYKESDESLDRAESRMVELYTKSLTQAGGMLLLNDTTMDYAGEPFERALTNVFRALNYVFLGELDEALVESRKVELFLDELGRRMGKKSAYKDDAFARYLDYLLYDDQGKSDDARISLEAANAAYSWYASDYHLPPPSFDSPRASSGQGELVFIHYNGVAPRKVSKTFQVAWGRAIALAKEDADSSDARFRNALRAGIAGQAVTVSHPEYVQDPYRIVSSEVFVDTRPAARTVLMEDISAIAMKNLQDRMPLIETRAIARATIKYVIAESLSREADRSCDKRYGAGNWQSTLCKAATRGLAHGTAAATETADTRAWTVLPSQIRMARVPVPPGTHSIRIDFKDGAGETVTTAYFKDVKIGQAKRTYLAYRTAL